MFINIEERESVFVCFRNRQREMAVMRVRYKMILSFVQQAVLYGNMGTLPLSLSSLR